MPNVIAQPDLADLFFAMARQERHADQVRPVRGAQPLPVTFSWAEAPGCADYRLQLADDIDFEGKLTFKKPLMIKGRFKGVILLGGCANNAVALVAAVSTAAAAQTPAAPAAPAAFTAMTNEQKLAHMKAVVSPTMAKVFQAADAKLTPPARKSWRWRLLYLRAALDIPYAHHEWWNGKGYPQGLREEKIPLSARIFAVVDVYDALVSDRPYRKALPTAEAFRILREEVKRGWWDAALVDKFEAMLNGGQQFSAAGR